MATRWGLRGGAFPLHLGPSDPRLNGTSVVRPRFRLFDVATRERLSDSEALLRERQKCLAARADELPEDAGGLGWIRDGVPVGQRHRGADSSVYLCHQGGTAEHAHASLLHEPTQRGDIICRGVADDAVSCEVSVVSLALRRHAS
jgi:hypothetical protein